MTGRNIEWSWSALREERQSGQGNNMEYRVTIYPLGVQLQFRSMTSIHFRAAVAEIAEAFG